MYACLEGVVCVYRGTLNGDKPLLERNTELWGKSLDQGKMKKEYCSNFEKLSLHLLIFSSNKFEGSLLSKGETMKILETFEKSGLDKIREKLADEPSQTKRGQPPSRRVVLQHFIAAHYLCTEPSKTLSLVQIKEVHRLLTEGLLDDDGENINPGEFRTSEIRAGQHYFIHPRRVRHPFSPTVEYH